MALINCPECQKQVSEHSINCPNCGYPINQLENKTVVRKEGCFLQTLNLGCLIFLIMIAIIFIAGAVAMASRATKFKEPTIKTHNQDGNKRPKVHD